MQFTRRHHPPREELAPAAAYLPDALVRLVPLVQAQSISRTTKLRTASQHPLRPRHDSLAAVRNALIKLPESQAQRIVERVRSAVSIAYSQALRYAVIMTSDRLKRLADESESKLDAALRTSVRSNDATEALARLSGAFDARRRRREAIAIAESARAASRAPTHEGAP